MQLRAKVQARQELQQAASVDFASGSTAWCLQCCLQYTVMHASLLLGHKVAMRELCYELFDSNMQLVIFCAALLETVSIQPF